MAKENRFVKFIRENPKESKILNIYLWIILAAVGWFTTGNAVDTFDDADNQAVFLDCHNI